MSKRSAGWWAANIGMLVGGLLWLASELFGVYRNSTEANPGTDTTSQWVWREEKRFWILRPLIVVFFLSLIGHFLFHTTLLP